MRNKKKLVAILLVVVLAFSMTAFVSAEEAIVVDNGCCVDAVSAYEGIEPLCIWWCPFPVRGSPAFCYCGQLIGWICVNCGNLIWAW
ncbi:MAG: hypothetical protein FWD05_12135 [Oscillospiraceae bacterium]|nr:hypothetical protein [Oscillospiraceae bacterium]